MDSKEMRELDAWIAEHVTNMGQFVGLMKCGLWYRPDAHGYTNRESEAWHLTRDEARKHKYLGGDEPVTICDFPIPNHTTDPAAAMQVLEACAKKVAASTHAVSLAENQGNWCVCEHPPVGSCINHAMAETLPLAIALFAKKLFSEK